MGFTVREVARQFHVSTATVYGGVKAGKLAHVRLAETSSGFLRQPSRWSCVTCCPKRVPCSADFTMTTAEPLEARGVTMPSYILMRDGDL